MRVLVIGSGVIGLFCALRLRQDGHEVIVIDKEGPDGDKCSLGNAGIVVPSHFVPLAAPGMVAAGLKMLAKRDSPFRIKPALDPDLAKWCLLFTKFCTHDHVRKCAPVLLESHLTSRDEYASLANTFPGAFQFRADGMLMVCGSQSGFEEEIEVAGHALELGLTTKTVNRDRFADLNLGVQVDAVGAIFYQDDCCLVPQLLVSHLVGLCSSLGVSFTWNTGIVEWTTGSGSTKSVVGAETTQGKEEFDAVVVAAGAKSAKLLKPLGVNLFLQPGKGLSFESRPNNPIPRLPFLLKEARMAVTPMGQVTRFGGTMELGEWSLEPDELRVKGMVESVPKVLPEFTRDRFDLAGKAVWAGLRPCSPDGLPYIGATAQVDNLFVATGHGMMGVSLAPVTGQIIAAALRGEKTEALYSPDRLA